MVTRLWTGQLGNWGLVPSNGRNFCLCWCYCMEQWMKLVQDCSVMMENLALKGLRTNLCHFNRGSSTGCASNRGDAERRNVHHWNWRTCNRKEWRRAQITTSIWWVTILSHNIASFFVNPKAWQPDALIQVYKYVQSMTLANLYAVFIISSLPFWYATLMMFSEIIT